jgi:O-methyltransferase
VAEHHNHRDVRVAIDDPLATSRWGRLTKRWVSGFELRVLEYYKRDPSERVGLEIVKELYARQASSLAIVLRGAMPVLFSPGELLTLWQQGQLLKEHGGAFAEVGAFQGTSAEVVCRAKGHCPFYVFEAFAGLPRPADRIDARYRDGLFASNEEHLRLRLQQYPNTTVIPGYFPDTGSCIENERFSFVHLDLDLYESTSAALTFFYPRLLPGGRIITHDYSQSEGVWLAVDEFLVDKPESVETVGATQAIITKRP